MFRTATEERSISSQSLIEPTCELAALADDVVVDRAYQMLAESCQFHCRSHSFRVVHSKGVITVDGVVPSFYLKQLLQELLKRVDGVQHIDNQVDVVALDELSSVRNGNTRSLRSRP